MFQISSFKFHNNRGFSMIELVIVMTIFIVIVDVVASMFILIVKHQKQILQEQEFSNQASYGLEYISRLTRVAIVDQGGSCLQSGGTIHPGYIYLLTHYNVQTGFYEGIKFVSPDNTCEEFFLDSDGIIKETKNGNAAQNILSGAFTVLHAGFIINGNKSLSYTANNQSIQPRVTMLLEIQQAGSTQKKILQTTVSQRNLNTNL